MAYSLANSYQGESFLSGFSFSDGKDPSNGFVDYQSHHDAESMGLFSIDEGTQVVRLGVDSNNTYGLDEGRPSVRLESKETYTHGLFIADFLHMPPSQCGLWPAFWAYGTEWPVGGELDIIEGANDAHQNIISAHTADGCFQDESQDGLFSGHQRNTECFIGEQNIGCGYDPPASDPNSYGDSFNAVGGGVYAMQWDDEHIKVWHFRRSEIPSDIESKRPQPDNWGLPQAVFGGNSCDVDDYFKDMSLVININFCGDYGNALWDSSASCTGYASSCPEYVANNPEAFTNAYWDVSYIDAYTWHSNATTLSSSSSPSSVSSSPEPTTVSTTATSMTTEDTDSTIAPVEAVLPTNPATVGDYAYLGCFASDSNFHTFDKILDADNKSMDLNQCVKLCKGKTYAGVRGGECSCAKSIDPDTRAAPSDNQCSTPCPGDDSQICGDKKGKLLTVYADVKHEEPPQPPPMAAPMSADSHAIERLKANVETLTVTRCPEETKSAFAPAQTRLAAAKGPLSNMTKPMDPPVSGATVERKGPGKMSVLVGVAGVLLMLVI